jgi:hypothetical protein
MASVYPLPEDSAPDAGAGVTGNRPLLLLGFVLVAAWVLLSFRLFSNSRN